MFGKPRIWLRSPCVALIWSFAPVTCESNPSNTLDKFTVMIDFQSSVLIVRNLMSKTWVRHSREIRLPTDEVEPYDERVADSSVVTGGSDPLDEFPVSLDEPNEKIT